MVLRPTLSVCSTLFMKKRPQALRDIFSYRLNCICEGVIDLLPHFLLIKDKPQPVRPLIWGTRPPETMPSSPRAQTLMFLTGRGVFVHS